MGTRVLRQRCSLALLFFSLLVLLCLMLQSARAATYYVATTGDDINAGTSLTVPFRTVSKAMNKAVAGDTVYLRGGTYREQVDVFAGGGSSGKYVTVTAYSSEVPVIKGSDVVSGWVQHSGAIWKK